MNGDDPFQHLESFNIWPWYQRWTKKWIITKLLSTFSPWSEVFCKQKWVFPTMTMVNMLPSMTGWFETLGKARKRSQFSRGDWLMKAMLGPVFRLPKKKQSWKLTEEKGGHVVGLLVANVFLVECLWLCVTFCTLNSCHFLYANFVGHYRGGNHVIYPQDVHNSGWRIKEVKEVQGTTLVRGLSILVLPLSS